MASQVDIVGGLASAWTAMSRSVREAVFAPGGAKTLEMQYSVEQAAALLGRSPPWLRKAIAGIEDLAPEVRANGRGYYDIHKLQAVREALGVGPHKRPDEKAVVIAFQNFKGGVAKTTLSVHFAHYLALRGYRVLLIDCDSQASATSLLGLNAVDYDSPSTATLLQGAPLGDVVQPTCWPTLKAVSSNLSLQDVEYEMVADSGQEGYFVQALGTLRNAIQDAHRDFDVVILDPPPAMGLIGLNVMTASTGMIVPMPAKQVDFLSGVQFFRMLSDMLAQLERHVQLEYSFLKLLCSNFETSRTADKQVFTIMQRCSGGSLLPTPLAHWEAVKAASVLNRSVYELDKPAGSPTSHRNCLNNLDLVFREIEYLVRSCWPSHRQSLEREMSRAGMVPVDLAPESEAA